MPEGQTPLDDKLGHRLIDVLREGAAARDSGAGSPYHGHSLEHCLHAAGWVSRDLRIALDARRADAAEMERKNAAMREVIEAFDEVLSFLRKEAPGTPLNNHRFDNIGIRAYAAVSHARATLRPSAKGGRG